VRANVVTASALGMRAFQVEGVSSVRERLTLEGLLDSSRQDRSTA
jgi:hypothetical protein